MIAFTVPGCAAPQGSKTYLGKGRMVESSVRLRPWRAAVTAAAAEARNGAATITGPVNLAAVFAFPRPASHYGTGRNAGQLKPSAPPFPIGHNVGDLSKLIRAVEDAITDSGAWRDDSLVVSYHASGKRWCLEGESPRTAIVISEELA